MANAHGEIFLCEVKALSYYRNSQSCAVYLTVKNVATNTIFCGKITVASLPTFLLDPFIQVYPDNSVSDELIPYKQRIGKEIITTNINRYPLLKIANVNGQIECSNLANKS